VIGDDFDHKAVAPTFDLLSMAFPCQDIIALGPASVTSPRVRTLPSATLAEPAIGRLYADVRLVVFPSYYEGFGFPLMIGFSYDRTVVARRSLLLDEIASRYRGPGRLVAYDTPLELAERVGCLLHGEECPTEPLGGALEGLSP
jgi:glycosyltransferase involved in cell wall biosynthesis